MNQQKICPGCENTQQESIIPRQITVGKVKGEVWVCKACTARAIDHIAWAAHLLHAAINDTVEQHRPPVDPEMPF